MAESILVPIKRVIDAYVKIHVKADHSGVETQHVKMSINPFDEIALEAALQLKEQGKASEVVLVSIGEKACQETLRHGLALGADRAIFCQSSQIFEPLAIAKILQKIVEQESPRLVIMGKQAIDDDNNQVPQMLAALLNWPQATYASEIAWQGEQVQVVREVDGGLQTVRCVVPAVISCDLRLNTPRYATLPNIMKAKSKPITEIDVASLQLSIDPRVTVLSVMEPPQRRQGERVENVSVLVDKLKNEAKVI